MHVFRSRFFVTILSALCILSTAAIAKPSETTSDENAPVTRKELPKLVREILVNNPNILLEASKKMQLAQEGELFKKAKEGIAKHQKELYSDPDSPTFGPADADVTVVEFFDYHCGYCKKGLNELEKLIKSDKKVRIVFKEYPILSDESRLAARVALAVNRIAKDKYFSFHKAVFDIKGSFTDEKLFAEAKKLGVNIKKLKKELLNSEIDDALARNKELGAAIGAQGTPAFIIGDNFYPGAIPHDLMKKTIAEIRKANANKK